METMSISCGYLSFILALQAIRRRSTGALIHVIASAIFPVASLIIDLNGLSAQNEGAFAAGFLGAILVQLLLLYRANAIWAAQATSGHSAHVPAGITVRERLKLLLAGIILLVFHNQYIHHRPTFFEMLDRGLFWVLITLVGASAIHAYVTAKHPPIAHY
ncbi:MAG TPA: hypothetical protein PKM25_12095 [Candidatus Ozemobacteraceae bacterium]|nr:hypothetical protein [Candidatus Ozemobacteraceae bacterium]